MEKVGPDHPDYVEKAHGYEMHPLLRRLQELGKEVKQYAPFIHGIELISEEEVQILGKAFALMEFSRVGGQFMTIETPETFEFLTEATVKKGDKEKRFRIGDMLVLNPKEQIEIVGEGPVVVLVSNCLTEDPLKQL